jgi:hypothetical protein
MALSADFSGWLGNTERSDCVLRISVRSEAGFSEAAPVDADGPSSPKRRCAPTRSTVRELHAHCIILQQQSEFVRCTMKPCWSKVRRAPVGS